jgi:hypothetical protein
MSIGPIVIALLKTGEMLAFREADTDVVRYYPVGHRALAEEQGMHLLTAEEAIAADGLEMDVSSDPDAPWRSAYFMVQWDEVTGECNFGCGGDSVDGHKSDCVWLQHLPASADQEPD